MIIVFFFVDFFSSYSMFLRLLLAKTQIDLQRLPTSYAHLLFFMRWTSKDMSMETLYYQFVVPAQH